MPSNKVNTDIITGVIFTFLLFVISFVFMMLNIYMIGDVEDIAKTNERVGVTTLINGIVSTTACVSAFGFFILALYDAYTLVSKEIYDNIVESVKQGMKAEGFSVLKVEDKKAI